MSIDEITQVIQKLRFNQIELYCETCYTQFACAWGGSVMTEWECEVCHRPDWAGSTVHNVLCLGCAIKTGRCAGCNVNEHMYVPRRGRPEKS